MYMSMDIEFGDPRASKDSKVIVILDRVPGRAKNRHLNNMAYIVNVLSDWCVTHGYKIVRLGTRNLWTDYAVLSRAVIILAAHGGWLWNLIFAPNLEVVIEFWPLLNLHNSMNAARTLFMTLAYSLPGVKFFSVGTVKPIRSNKKQMTTEGLSYFDNVWHVPEGPNEEFESLIKQRLCRKDALGNHNLYNVLSPMTGKTLNKDLSPSYALEDTDIGSGVF